MPCRCGDGPNALHRRGRGAARRVAADGVLPDSRRPAADDQNAMRLAARAAVVARGARARGSGQAPRAARRGRAVGPALAGPVSGISHGFVIRLRDCPGPAAASAARVRQRAGLCWHCRCGIAESPQTGARRRSANGLLHRLRHPGRLDDDAGDPVAPSGCRPLVYVSSRPKNQAVASPRHALLDARCVIAADLPSAVPLHRAGSGARVCRWPDA